jgi:hypothetical protein
MTSMIQSVALDGADCLRKPSAISLTLREDPSPAVSRCSALRTSEDDLIVQSAASRPRVLSQITAV